MIEEHAQFFDLRSTRTNFALRKRNVFAVLPASGIGTVSRGHKSQRPANAVQLHLTNGICQHGMPVAIAPVYRQLRPVLREFGFESRDQLTGLLVDRTLA